MNVQPIVEGKGEVPAVPVLLRRIRNEAQAYRLEINDPIRWPRSKLVREEGIRTAVQLARKQERCAAILILFDSDDDCPKTMAPAIQAWAQDEASPLPCFVVMAHREFEAWFLAAVESLRGKRGIQPDATSHPNPENVRGAAEELELRMVANRSYVKTADQPALCAAFDLTAAYRRCRSFRRLTNVFGLLARGIGLPLEDWPPRAWIETA
jgi:hypothetical protein